MSTTATSETEHARQMAKYDLMYEIFMACGAGSLEDGSLARALFSSGFGPDSSTQSAAEAAQEPEFHCIYSASSNTRQT